MKCQGEEERVDQDWRNRRAGQDEEGDEANQVNQNASTFDYHRITLLFHFSRPLLSYLFDLESTLLSLSLSVSLGGPKKEKNLGNVLVSHSVFPCCLFLYFLGSSCPHVLLGRLFNFSGDLLINFFEYFGDSWSRRPVDSLITLSHGRKDGSGDCGDSFSSGIFRFFFVRFSISCVSTVVLKEFF